MIRPNRSASGTYADQNQHQLIEALIKTRLNNTPLWFDTEMYRYENIDDQTQQRLRRVIKVFFDNLLGEIGVGEVGELFPMGIGIRKVPSATKKLAKVDLR